MSKRIEHGIGLLLKLDSNTISSINNINIPNDLTRKGDENLQKT
jgi:hypothetical protein